MLNSLQNPVGKAVCAVHSQQVDVVLYGMLERDRNRPQGPRAWVTDTLGSARILSGMSRRVSYSGRWAREKLVILTVPYRVRVWARVDRHPQVKVEGLPRECQAGSHLRHHVTHVEMDARTCREGTLFDESKALFCSDSCRISGTHSSHHAIPCNS